jgi:ABC transport system ATP-binding/permease protein
MGIGVNTTELRLLDRRHRAICDGLYLRAVPGTLTAIMGPCGCGKSVLLRLLTGYERPTQGRIFFGASELWSDYEKVRDIIGYVPQAEVMIPELRVAESLDYRMRFRFRGRSARERSEQIRRTCVMLGLGDLDNLLAKRVGSPEWRGEYPSGGERRRINIAHEVLSQPQVLFMDEPTSGLAFIDADGLIKQMRILAAERDIPVVMTIHAPGRETFDCFQDVLVMGMGGVLAYYGPRSKAAGFFQQTTPISYQGENPAEYILKCVSNEPHAAREASSRFRECRQEAGFDYLIRPVDGVETAQSAGLRTTTQVYEDAQ